ncbi:sulfite exporter TauE/SafE family protein [Aestuariivirga sp.]|uniref:sulfite exporter TauE/SafE family protein n=1 Tax=Aestuariivirga sp. TaxID=2650926 RepID=UPI0039191059
MTSWRRFAAFVAGAAVGALGGLIGLGGAEFRLPLLIGFFGFEALPAVILNKAMSLVVVAFSIPFRIPAVPLTETLAHWPVVVNLLSGSIVGAWVGASWAIGLRTSHFYRIIAALLLLMAAALLFGHAVSSNEPLLTGTSLAAAGTVAGFFIGVVASLLGVAGGELLIPTIVLLYGIDVKVAGSLSLLVSLPTMILAFARYSRDGSFAVVKDEAEFAALMAAGSICGAFAGGQLLKMFSGAAIVPLLSAILVLSAWRMWRHAQK